MNISCQESNYQIFVKYFKYFLNICILSHHGNVYLIKMLKMVNCNHDKGEFKVSVSHFTVGILFE